MWATVQDVGLWADSLAGGATLVGTRVARIRRLPCREWADSVVGLGKAHDFPPCRLYKKALASEVT